MRSCLDYPFQGYFSPLFDKLHLFLLHKQDDQGKSQFAEFEKLALVDTTEPFFVNA